jgi:hypothetical protein
VVEQFTLASFADRLGQTFRVNGDGKTLALKLVNADAATLSAGERATSPSRREPFSIVFLGPHEPLLPQRIYAFEHVELGSFEIFIVPIAHDADGVRYEAIFT